ncbi:MAG TPA: nucleotidyl transferase AbiEii/AbiGii toxin family protein, partial [Streptosporangiaceae bacterium]
MAAGDKEPGLSAFQLEVARPFFALPASQGFLLAGGAALLAQHLMERPTEDLDFFTAPERGHVPAARCPGGRSPPARLVRTANP